MLATVSGLIEVRLRYVSNNVVQEARVARNDDWNIELAVAKK